jgi:hypothetical protein
LSLMLMNSGPLFQKTEVEFSTCNFAGGASPDAHQTKYHTNENASSPHHTDVFRIHSSDGHRSHHAVHSSCLGKPGTIR